MTRRQVPGRGASRAPLSRAAMRRQIRAEAAREADTTVETDPTIIRFLETYQPSDIPVEVWNGLRPIWANVLTLSRLSNLSAVKKYGRPLAMYLGWRHAHGHSTAIVDMLTLPAITAWYRTVMDGNGPISVTTAADYRQRLDFLAVETNPTPESFRLPTAGHDSVKPLYTETELAMIKRLALRQSNPTTRRHICAIVGLCAGAGLDSNDLRALHRRDIDDCGDNGIRIRVAGTKARWVMVRHDYEHLVRVGLDGLQPHQLVLGTNKDRKAIASKPIERAEWSPDCPPVTASRLRTSWIASLMTRNIPIAVILQASGLTSASTITDIAKQLPPIDQHDIDLFLLHLTPPPTTTSPTALSTPSTPHPVTPPQPKGNHQS